MFLILSRISRIVSIIAAISIANMVFEDFGSPMVVSFIGILSIIKFVFLNDNFIRKSLYKEKLDVKNQETFEEEKIEAGYEEKSHFENKKTYNENIIPDVVIIEDKSDEKSIEDKEIFEKDENVGLKNTTFKPKEDNEKNSFSDVFGRFKHNTLAKIGGLLVFVGVLFLLKLTYDFIPEWGKFGLGIVFGFGSLLTGIFIHRKGYDKEGEVLLGVGLLINYLVILAGRYVLHGDFANGDFHSYFLTENITFLYIIINTILAIIIAVFYKSKRLLISAFIIAYSNPLLAGMTSTGTPQGLVSYSLIISIGLFASKFIWERFGNGKGLENIGIIAFLLGNILFLMAPIKNAVDIGPIRKFGSVVLLTIISVFSFYFGSSSSEQLFQKTKLTFVKVILFLGFVVLGIQILIVNSILYSDLSPQAISLQGLITTIISISLLFVMTIILSFKKGLENLSLLGIIATGILLSAFIHTEYIYLGVFIFAIYGIIQFVLLFLNKNLRIKQLISIPLTIAGISFTMINLLFFLNKYTSIAELGYLFLGIFVIYLVGGFLINIWDGKEDTLFIQNKNFPLTITLWIIGLSALTISIALMFNGNDGLVSILRLIEGTLLYLAYTLTKNQKLSQSKSLSFYRKGNIIFAIGLFKLFFHIYETSNSLYIPLILSFLFVVANLFILKSEKKAIFHDILHIFGIIIIGLGSGKIVKILGYESYRFFTISIYGLITSLVYVFIKNRKILYAFFIIYGLFLIASIINTYTLIGSGDFLSNYGTAIGVLLTYILYKTTTKNKDLTYLMSAFIGTYLILISTFFVYEVSGLQTLSITVWWGLLSTLFLIYGILSDNIKRRTVGLYILSATLIKIIIYDVWTDILSNSVQRVVVLIIIGLVMIGISMLYTRKYKSNLMEEINIRNLKK